MLRGYASMAGACVALLVATSAPVAGAQYAGPVAVAQHAEAVAVAPPPVQNQTVVNIAAGATLNSGNTEAYAGNVGGRLGLIRERQQLTLEVLGTLGAAKNDTTNKVEQTAANVIGRARYDVFLSPMNALFAAVQPRRDTFAGLALRVQMQGGYARNLYSGGDDHRFWTELGYDLTYDDFAAITTTTVTDLTSTVAASVSQGGTITRTTSVTSDPGHDFVNSGRGFLGYINRVHPAANLNLGVETLFDVQDKKNVRVNGLAEITSSVSSKFKLGIQGRMFFDNVPVPGKKKADSVVAVQLVYTFDSLTAAPAPAPAPCDCSSEVAASTAACATTAAAEPTPAPAAEPVAVEAPAPAASEPSAAGEVPAPAADAPVPTTP